MSELIPFPYSILSWSNTFSMILEVDLIAVVFKSMNMSD